MKQGYFGINISIGMNFFLGLNAIKIVILSTFVLQISGKTAIMVIKEHKIFLPSLSPYIGNKLIFRFLIVPLHKRK